MSMLQIHRSALEEVIVPYHNFLLAQQKSKKQLFGFVEGEDDPSYYQTHIDSIISNEDWEVNLIEAGYPKGNKKRVLQLINIIDWNRYSSKQTVFFVDRDLSDFFDEISNYENLYVTDYYSIENNIVSVYTLRRVLKELFHVHFIDYEFNIVKELFEEGIRRVDSVVEIMTCWYILLRKQGKKPVFDDIQLNKLCEVNKCKVVTKKTNEIEYYIKNKWNYDYTGLDIADILSIFQAKNENSGCIRGKYIMWFFVEFINSFCANCNEIIPSMDKPITGFRELSLQYAVKDIGTRSKTPISLNLFIEKTFLAYIAEHE